MPSTYAHYKCGQEVYKRLNSNTQRVISSHTDLFNIGVHGPDILFYYNVLIPNKVNKIGYGVHRRSGKEFMLNALKVLEDNNTDFEHLAYLYGFICHFSLDVICHPTVFGKTKEDGTSHGEIENEFDRELMIRDDLNPITKILTNHIKPTEDSAKVIKDFYYDTTTKTIYKTLRDMVFYLNALVAPSKVKRNFLYLAFRLTGHYKSLKGMIINYNKNEACQGTTEELIKLYPKAVDLAVELIQEIDNNLKTESDTIAIDKILLNDKYNYNFNGEKIDME